MHTMHLWTATEIYHAWMPGCFAVANMRSALVIRIKLAWWLRWYLIGVVLMSRMTGAQPDEDKLLYWIRRAMIVRVE